MTAPEQVKWLAGRKVLVAGTGAAGDAIANGFERLGAIVVRERKALADAAEIAASFASAESALGGPVDILVHSGSVIADAEPVAMTIEEWRSGFSADIDGRFLHAAEFARRTNDAKGRGSILLLLPSDRLAAGRSAKASAHGALDNLVKSLAVEWSRDAIRTNAIASIAVEDFAAQPAEVQTSLVNLAAYIASDYGAYITGMVMGVDELA